MKEKLKEHKKELILGGSMVAALVALGINYTYQKGFQRGCDCLFAAVVEEFPSINFSEFFTKYHK